MTIEISLLISGLAVAVSLYFGTKNSKRNDKQDTKQDAAEMTMVIVKLENINTGINKIEAKMNSFEADIKDINEKYARMDESLKSAWKRIEIIEKSKERMD